MRRFFPFTAGETLPAREAVLMGQGIPPGAEVSERTEGIVSQASDLFEKKAQPVGLFQTITQADFEEVHNGDGRNDLEAAMLHIYPKAGHLALFAATMGEEICAEIESRFDDGDYAVGSMLDSFASAGAEKMSEFLASEMERELQATGIADENWATLAYSPGYCGWNVSGQTKLFAHLKPVETGIELKEKSHLMVPIKSISGVLVSGEREIHLYENNYVSCTFCRGKTCVDRHENIREKIRKHNSGEGGNESPAGPGEI